MCLHMCNILLPSLLPIFAQYHFFCHNPLEVRTVLTFATVVQLLRAGWLLCWSPALCLWLTINDIPNFVKAFCASNASGSLMVKCYKRTWKISLQVSLFVLVFAKAWHVRDDFSAISTLYFCLVVDDRLKWILPLQTSILLMDWNSD